MNVEKIALEWVSASDASPEISDGYHSVTVLVTQFDPVYDELSHGEGAYVSTAVWDGKSFKQIGYSGSDGYIFLPCSDEVTHWAYMPKAARRQNDEI